MGDVAVGEEEEEDPEGPLALLRQLKQIGNHERTLIADPFGMQAANSAAYGNMEIGQAMDSFDSVLGGFGPMDRGEERKQNILEGI